VRVCVESMSSICPRAFGKETCCGGAGRSIVRMLVIGAADFSFKSLMIAVGYLGFQANVVLSSGVKVDRSSRYCTENQPGPYLNRAGTIE
jgi:hypothetical protein